MSSDANASSPSSEQLQASDDHRTFLNFFNCWLVQQNRNLAQLYSALNNNNNSEENENNSTSEVVNQVMGNYEYYYHAKTASAGHNVLPMFTPTWTSRTDNLFIWVGGWRPTTAFRILYSKGGIQCAGHMVQMGRDLGGLSREKMEKIESMQRETVTVEKQISEEVAAYQETVGSAELVGISHEVTEAQNSGGEESEGLVEAAMAGDMEEKRNRMKGILEKADALRFNTLKRVVEVLNPMQAAHFLIAVTELLLRVHEFGQSMDFAADVDNNQT